MNDAQRIRWFDRDKRIGLLLVTDDAGSLILRRGGVDHHFTVAERKTLLRALRRMRDFEEGQRAQREREHHDSPRGTDNQQRRENS